MVVVVGVVRVQLVMVVVGCATLMPVRGGRGVVRSSVGIMRMVVDSGCGGRGGGMVDLLRRPDAVLVLSCGCSE